MSYRRKMEPRPMAPCTSLQRDILITISGLGCASGIQVLDALREQYWDDDEKIPNSTFYHHLRQLDEMGLVVKVPAEERTKKYEVSSVARKQLIAYRRWVVECIEPPEIGDGH